MNQDDKPLLPLKNLFNFLIFITLFVWQIVASADDFNLCQNIYVKDGRIELNKNEKTLVCGSDQGPLSWRDIPVTQTELHLKSILQNMGYLDPKFERTPDQLWVWRGNLTRIQSLHIEGADGVLHDSKKRKIIDAALTPAKLNEVETWANSTVRSLGYACPRMNVEAHGWDGQVLLKTELGEIKKFGPYDVEGLDGLHTDILRRYQPFDDGHDYDIRETQIMTDRLLSDGLFQSAFFETNCAAPVFSMRLKTLIGPPKIFRVGIGASTEELPFADFSFRNARLDDNASSLTATLHGSPRLQSLNVDSELYWLPSWTRMFIAPRLLLSREIESSYQADSTRSGIDVGRKWDFWNTRLMARVGPSLNTIKTTSGLGPTMTYPTLEASVTMMSHNYEYGIADQYEGWTSSLFLQNQSKGTGSDVDVTRYEFNFKYLWNIGQYSPPLLVLGTRAQAVVIETGSEESLEQLPKDDRVFAGGNQNLRGFARQSINNFGLGYLTFVYLGFELRLIEELPYHIQPFILWDLGRVGTKGTEIDKPVYTSEGFGARWQSPFGTFMGSYARGRVFNKNEKTDSAEQWIFFFSFGQEF